MSRRWWIVLVLVGAAFCFGTSPEARGDHGDDEEDAVLDYFTDVLFDGSDGTIGRFMTSVLCGLKRLVCWGAIYIGDLLMKLLEDAADKFPNLSDYAEKWEEALDWLKLANAWVPIGWGMSCVGSYLTFYLFTTAIRRVMRMIPTMGW